MDILKYLEANKAHWNEIVSIHKATELYALEEFKKGKNKLHSLELSELGNISGKKVLHLQCHFGMDTLSLEMLGAEVTGVDFSEEGIRSAEELRDELGMKARFIHSDLYSLPDKLDETFDIVFTSYGVLIWLPDIRGWGQIVSRYLTDDGFFYMAECHPLSMIFENLNASEPLRVKYPYFEQAEPVRFEEEGTYADRKAKTVNNVTYEWSHSLSDIFMSLIDAGLKIEFFHEHPFTVWEQFPGMKKGDDGYYRLDENIPLLFSIKALKS
jgi:SAM-dependent methyltransferase